MDCTCKMKYSVTSHLQNYICEKEMKKSFKKFISLQTFHHRTFAE